MYSPSHPGEFLPDLMKCMSITNLAEALDVSRNTASRLLHGRRSVTPEMAIKLEKAFPQFSADTWLQLQAQYDVWHLKHDQGKLHKLPGKSC